MSHLTHEAAQLCLHSLRGKKGRRPHLIWSFLLKNCWCTFPTFFTAGLTFSVLWFILTYFRSVLSTPLCYILCRQCKQSHKQIVRCSALDLVLSVMLSTGPFIRLHFSKPGEQLIDYPCHLPPLNPLCKDKCRPWNRTLCLPRFRLISCRNNYLNRVILTNPTISRLGASNPEDLRLHGILSLIALHNKDELSRGKDNIKFPLRVFTLVCYWQLMV